MAQVLALAAAIVATIAPLIVIGLGLLVASLAFRNAIAFSRSRWVAAIRPVHDVRRRPRPTWVLTERRLRLRVSGACRKPRRTATRGRAMPGIGS